jgi:hypothetical protein
VMLIVVPSNGDVANQDIIEKAEDLDPEGDRTFGILTKPDLVDEAAEQAVIDLVDGKRQVLKLGWHILRNPGQAGLGIQHESRQDMEESFFKSVSPWNRIDKTKVGVGSLRSRLQDILANHIRLEFPKARTFNYYLRARKQTLTGRPGQSRHQR